MAKELKAHWPESMIEAALLEHPARSFTSATAARDWVAIWIYFVAPPLDMLAAAELYSRKWGDRSVQCAKLHHDIRHQCIFCEYHFSKQGGGT